MFKYLLGDRLFSIIYNYRPSKKIIFLFFIVLAGNDILTIGSLFKIGGINYIFYSVILITLYK